MRARNKHSLSHYKLLTMDMGVLVPAGLVEVLPGDSFRHSVSILVRASPLLAPVMHPISVRLHNFFVPCRLLWDDWEDFITGGDDGLGAASGNPKRGLDGVWNAQGTLADYFGIPPVNTGFLVNMMPFRAYTMIYNEFYRDQDLIARKPLQTAGSAEDLTTNVLLQRIAWEKDYFTAARPWPQKGPAVTLPLAGTATAPTFKGVAPGGRNLVFEAAGTDARWNLAHGTAEAALWDNPQLIATVTDLRRSVALQRYQEARAMYGSEYVDYLQMAFGVRSSDARMQRPEYLGGGKQTIAFSEVLQTGPDSDVVGGSQGVGQLRGHGIAAMRSNTYTRFFEEHGYVISLLSVRPRSIYGEGLHKMWARSLKEDWYQKELEFIGQEPVLNREVRAQHATGGNTFGWSDRYATFRSVPSGVAGEFRSTLDFWHLSRKFAADPALNATFVECAPGKRIHAEQTGHQLWIMVNHNLKARRIVQPPSPGRIL